MSLGGRLVNIFAAPGEVFDSVKAASSSHANWLVPALVLMLVSWLGAWLILSQPAIQSQLSDLAQKQIQKMVEKGRIPKDKADAISESAARMSRIQAAGAAVIIPIFIALVSPFWWGLWLWLVGRKALKGEFRFMKAVEVVGLANMIGVLGEVIRMLLVISLGNILATPSLSLLLRNPDPQSTIFGLLSLLNVMTLWELGTRSVGLARISNTSTGKAAIWVFGLWLGFMGFLFGVGQAVRLAFGG